MRSPSSHAPAQQELPLLELDGLRTYFDTLDGTVRSVNGVSYELRAGETLTWKMR